MRKPFKRCDLEYLVHPQCCDHHRATAAAWNWNLSKSPVLVFHEVLDLESLRQCSFAINRSLHFVVANHEIEEGEVSLHLVDMDIVQQKKGKDKKESPRSPRSPRASEADEEVVGSMKISLKQLYEAEGLEIGGPFEFDAKELGKIDVKMHVHLSGLEPTSLETVNKMAVDEDKMAAEVEEILQEM